MNKMLQQIQVVLFSPEIAIPDKLKLAHCINEATSGQFNGDPMILPIPDDAPQEIPRIQLRSKDGQHILSVTKIRLDYVLQSPGDHDSLSLPDTDLFERIAAILLYMKDSGHAQITRCGIMTNWVIGLDKGPAANHLLSTYIKDQTAIIDPIELELHCLTNNTVANRKVNFWTHLRSARKKSDPEQDAFVAILMDMNTSAELPSDFDEDSVQAFLKESSCIMNSTLGKHIAAMEAVQ
ncbi:MAG: hypothetical protein SVY53_01430 [Chloroflexota bacterium]|nr:hypothetical protein [Chloroflexota bacterium]